MTLTPAYGRDYKSKKEVLIDFNSDKDFVVTGLNERGSFEDDGRYTNKSNLITLGIKRVQIRYKKLTQVLVMEIT